MSDESLVASDPEPLDADLAWSDAMNRFVAFVRPVKLTQPTLAEIEELHVKHVLSRSNGNKAEAARILGIDRRTLYRMCERYGIHIVRARRNERALYERLKAKYEPATHENEPSEEHDIGCNCRRCESG